MTQFGYTLMTEQTGPRDLVNYAIAAERAGFDFEVCSDHYSPWLMSQGHAPYAWSVLGAVAQATSRVELATYVTCPIIRYHPAVVAQKAATLQLLSEGRFILGLGSGENLNEHITGEGWPPVAQRQDMLVEAATIIRELQSGELVTWEGDYFRIDSARLWDAPEGGVPIAIAVSGEKSIGQFAPFSYCRDLRMAVDDPKTFYIPMSIGSRSDAGAFYRSTDIGVTWQRVDQPVTAKSTIMSMNIHATDPKKAIYPTRGGQIMWTEDGCTSWNEKQLPAEAGDAFCAAIL